jgi:hypothetical protein
MAGMAENSSPLAPSAVPPQQASTFFEVKLGQNNARRGPLRFEEGIATDTDVPGDFVVGVRQGIMPAAGRSNHNQNVFEKPAAEVMRERAHLGSAAWVEAPTFLGSFAGGAGPEAEVKFIQTMADGSRYERRNPAQVTD